MDRQLESRTALVTGATSGIGRAIAMRFGAAGAHVLISGRDTDRGAAVVAAIEGGGGRASFLAADLGSGASAATSLADRALAAADGRLDVLVNNAGIFPGGPTADVDEATFDAVYAVNVKAPFFLTAAIAPLMARQGGGAIVNLGSWGATLGIDGSALYSSSKAAVELLTRAWAAEFGAAGVRVNAIAPGVIRTSPGIAGDRRDQLMRGTPAGRPGDPDSIADAALYLASDAASFVHGTVLAVDGGRLATAVVANPPS
jgi:NAD(P)-dependent dehydrogenase (short-subunit alcohol dehydrogenase family)